MAINSLYTTTRMVGMYSGFDTDSLIETMLKSFQTKIDNQNRSLTKLQWKQSALNTVKDDITNLRATFLRGTAAQNMRTSSTYNSTVASLSGKNSDAVSVKTSVSSTAGTMTIDEVRSLAKGASVASQSSVSDSKSGFSGSTQLKDLVFEGGQTIDFTNGKAEITINGDTTIELSETDTLDDMIKKVNGSGAGVTMSYDRLSDKFKLESNTIGDSSQLMFSGDALSKMGLSSANVEAGSKAQVVINGELVESDKNTFDFRGVTLTLNRVTEPGDEKTTVTVKRDATEAVKKIKSFVDSYNSLISKLESLLKERKTSAESKYTPLTDEEKDAMSDEEIASWEAIAKKGLLYGDSGLQKVVSSLRTALYDAVEGAGLSPSNIGLSTGSYFDGKGGQIVLDEAKLTAALEKDPDQVMNVFMQVGDTNADEATQYKQNGLMNRIDDIFNKYLNKNQKTSLDNLAESIRRSNEQISNLETKMYREQEKLYTKFAAMETAMSKMQEQSSWLTSMMGGTT